MRPIVDAVGDRVHRIAPQGAEFGRLRIGVVGEARQTPEPSLCLAP